MTITRVLLVCCFVGTCFAKSDQDIKKWFIQQGVECSKDIPVSDDEFLKITSHQIPDNKNSKCLVACVFKKTGMVDDKGMFDESGSIKMSEKQYGDDKGKIEAAKKIYELCRKVNDEEVSDGDSGCERSALLATCLTENASDYGFSI